jgi:hypothetical protein
VELLLALLHVLKQVVEVFTRILLLAGREIGVTLSNHRLENLRPDTILVKFIRLVLCSCKFLSFDRFAEFP